MVSHILLPEIDDINPASMSKTIITDILRKDLKFDGLIVTDDMTMVALSLIHIDVYKRQILNLKNFNLNFIKIVYK